MGEFHSLADRLEAVADEIDEIAFDRLREAVADGRGKRPHYDKQLMQARRSIEKAIHVLRNLN